MSSVAKLWSAHNVVRLMSFHALTFAPTCTAVTTTEALSNVRTAAAAMPQFQRGRKTPKVSHMSQSMVM